MSSNGAPSDLPSGLPRASLSLAARLAAWYAGSAFALLLLATGVLYWGLVRTLDREDDNQIADQVRVLRGMLAERPGDLEAVRREAEEEFQSRQHTRVYVRLLDRDGKTLVETPGFASLLSTADFPVADSTEGVGGDARAADGSPMRRMAVRIGDGSGYVVQASMDRGPEAELLAEYREYLWAVLAASLAVSSAVGYRVARRGLRPIHLVIDTARRIRTSNLSERIPADGLPAELFSLAGHFNAMLDRLEGSFARMSRFSADIAHELRTPVNNLRGGTEVALGRPRTPDEYRDTLGSNLEEFARLSRTIDGLLFLARADDPRPRIARERLDIGGELASVCDYYEGAAAERGVRLTLEAPPGVFADFHRSMFQRAVGNLVENALRHTPAGGEIVVSVSGEGGTVAVSVADSGTGIPAEHLPHVFDRFYRADAARSSAHSRAGGNVGLGLAIVRGIVEMHGGTASIESEPGRGTRATLAFPLAGAPEMTES